MPKIRQSKPAAYLYGINDCSNFMPDSGRLQFLRLPESNRNVRVEAGVRSGDEISLYYDPMIAKVIAKGRDREDAIRRLDMALSQFHVVGVKTNIPFVRRILQNAAYRSGHVDTSFIEKHKKNLFAQNAIGPEQVALAAMTYFIHQSGGVYNDQHPWLSSKGSSQFLLRSTKLKLKIGSSECNVAVSAGDGLSYELTCVSKGLKMMV